MSADGEHRSRDLVEHSISRDSSTTLADRQPNALQDQWRSDVGIGTFNIFRVQYPYFLTIQYHNTIFNATACLTGPHFVIQVNSDMTDDCTPDFWL